MPLAAAHDETMTARVCYPRDGLEMGIRNRRASTDIGTEPTPGWRGVAGMGIGRVHTSNRDWQS
jgi:hypothetical protein